MHTNNNIIQQNINKQHKKSPAFLRGVSGFMLETNPGTVLLAPDSYPRLKFRNIMNQGIPKHLFAYMNIVMYQNMTHIDDWSPFYLCMGITKLLCQHVCGLTNDFYLLDQTIIH